MNTRKETSESQLVVDQCLSAAVPDTFVPCRGKFLSGIIAIGSKERREMAACLHNSSILPTSSGSSATE